MSTMRDIRRRIRTVQNIQQITKALKMVAAARLQRAQTRADAARPYANQMVAVLSQIASASGEIEHPLMEVREAKNIGVLVISSDRGMAGSYNSNVIRKVLEITSEVDKRRVKLITLGKKARMFFTRRGYEIIADYTMPSTEITITEARIISRHIQDLFESHKIDEVHIVYTRFFSAVKHQATALQILPAARPETGVDHVSKVEDYLFEPSPEELLGNLLPRYVDTQVFRAMLESLASEHGARMTAMSAATDNAGEMIDRLTLDLNRARQATITKELAEIVGGAEALK